jgi:hypothetical protein
MTSDKERKAIFWKLNNTHQSNLIKKWSDDDYKKIYKLTGKKKGCFTPDTGFVKPKIDKNGNLVRVEAVCGASTSAFEDYLKKKTGKKYGVAEQGHYIGNDKTNSEAYNPIEKVVTHEWLRLPDGTIIDGARGQFIPDNLSRNDLNKNDRLKFIPPMSPEQGAYYLRKKCSGCGSMLSQGVKNCPTCKMIKKIKDEKNE